MNNRGKLLVALGASVIAAPLSSFAQQQGKVWRVGFLASPSESYRRAAYYVDRILKGAKPVDMPIEQPMKMQPVVNSKTAKALGMAMPQTMLVQATKVIESWARAFVFPHYR